MLRRRERNQGEDATRDKRIDQCTAATNALQCGANLHIVALFHQIPDSSRSKRGQNDFFMSSRRDGNGDRVRMLLDPVDEFDPIAIGKSHINKREARAELRDASFRMRDATRHHNVVDRANQLKQKLNETSLRSLIVFDDQRAIE
jgi:hypothetical protein